MSGPSIMLWISGAAFLLLGWVLMGVGAEERVKTKTSKFGYDLASGIALGLAVLCWRFA